MRGDQFVVHVAGMARRVAQALQPIDLRQFTDQRAERCRAACLILAVPGVDVLAEQSDFAHARIGQRAGLFRDAQDGPRVFGAARIGHHAKRAELVATLLNGEEGRRSARQRLALLRRGQAGEFILDGEIRVDQRLARLVPARAYPRHEFGKAVIILRADNEIDDRGAAAHFLALGLGDAARDDDNRLGNFDDNFCGVWLDDFRQLSGNFGNTGNFPVAQASELGIDLFGGALADVAGVQDDDVGVFLCRGFGVTLRRHDVDHAGRVIDVHLATICFYEDFLLGCAPGRGGGLIHRTHGIAGLGFVRRAYGPG